jgi:hypothetical protein
MGTECPECGESYRRLTQHWAMSSSCSYPALPERWLGLLTGILMGDGTIHDPPSAANTRVDVCNICVTFLQWVDEKLEWLSNGVTLHRTSDEIRAENARSDLNRISSLDYDIRDQYVLTTRRHPALNRYRHWYDSEKRYPAEQDLRPAVLKQWYVCDGHLLWGTEGHRRPQVWLAVENERDRPGVIEGLFDTTPISPSFRSGRVMLTSDETEDFFEYIGDPVPGFEYKWAYEDRDRYDRLKDECREKHCTQTLE